MPFANTWAPVQPLGSFPHHRGFLTFVDLYGIGQALCSFKFEIIVRNHGCKISTARLIHLGGRWREDFSPPNS